MTNMIRSNRYFPIIALAVCVGGCTHTTTVMPLVQFALVDTQGKSAGVAFVTRVDASPMLQVDVKGLQPGRYAMHLHQTGKCDAPEFASAGPHWNPTSKKHGLANPDGPHAGDLPNFDVGASGRGQINTRIASMSASALLDADGTALVIHAKPDDNITDPSGNSGARIICGVAVQAAQSR